MKTYKDKQFYWRGQNWTIRKVLTPDDEVLSMKSVVGKLLGDKAIVMYRGDLDDDMAIMTILHELGHELFPEWETEPHQSSTSELGIFERDIKTFLEGAGVDLTKLLVE